MMRLLVNGRTQNGRDRPATRKAMTKGRDRDSCDLSPLYYCHTFPFQCKDAIAPPIPQLFFFDRPPAIFWTVALLVIDAVNRMFRGWTFAHVSEEGLEGMPPLRANQNPARSVVAIGRFFGVVATLKHVSPNLILTAFRHSVFGKEESGRFPLKAATTLAMSTAQESPSNDNGISTSAATQPADSPKCHFYRLERCKPFKLPVGEVLKSHAAIIDQQKETSPEFNRRKLP